MFANELFNPQTFTPSTFPRDSILPESNNETLFITDRVIYWKDYKPSILMSFITGSIMKLTQSDNIVLGNYPGGKDCKILGNQCSAIGLNTQAGYSIPFVVLNEQILILQDIIDTPFYNGCAVTLYNMGSNDISTTINNVSVDDTLNATIITFNKPISDLNNGYIALNSNYQAHAEGTSTIASAPDSHAGGCGAIADLPGKFARSDGYFNQPGDSQYSFLSAGITTIDATPIVLLAGNRHLFVRNNMSYMFIVFIGARQTDGSADAMFLRYGIINNVNNVVALSGDVVTLGTDINSNDWTISILADNTNKSLAIIVTGDNDSIIHWKCRLDCLEIG